MATAGHGKPCAGPQGYTYRGRYDTITKLVAEGEMIDQYAYRPLCMNGRVVDV
jgi:hypothetical protein